MPVGSIYKRYCITGQGHAIDFQKIIVRRIAELLLSENLWLKRFAKSFYCKMALQAILYLSIMNKKITVMVNGFTEKIPAQVSIGFLIAYFKEGDGDLIVEHNGRFVWPHEYENTLVSEGDRIEFINPNFGG